MILTTIPLAYNRPSATRTCTVILATIGVLSVGSPFASIA